MDAVPVALSTANVACPFCSSERTIATPAVVLPTSADVPTRRWIGAP